MDIVKKNRNGIITLCDKHNVKQMYAFSSVLTNEFNNSSVAAFLVNFNNIELLKHAIERNLEIVGKSTNKILLKNSSFPILNARNIIGLRNFMIYLYDNISDENIGGISINYLRNLKAKIKQSLNK